MPFRRVNEKEEIHKRIKRDIGLRRYYLFYKYKYKIKIFLNKL